MATHDLIQLGATGDGVTDATASLHTALAACARDGGGVVVVPTGRWRTGTLRLPARTTLRLDAGAVLVGSPDPAAWPRRLQPWEGALVERHAALVEAVDAEDVAIVGEGAIDGQGAPWWERTRRGAGRPTLLSFQGCRRVQVAGISLRNSPSWTVHPWRCEDVRLHGLTIRNPPDAPNTDGIDPESCRRVRISDCLIDVGDDAIVLKAGVEGDASGRPPPCEVVSITGCHLVRGHGGVVIGSEMSGGVRDVAITGCVMTGTDRGIRIKTRRGRGGVVEDVNIANVVMRGVGCPLVAHMYYRYTGLREADRARVASREAQPVDPGTPVIRGLRLHQVTARDVGGPCLALLYGLPESPIADVSLTGCDFAHAEQADPAQTEPAMMVHLAAGGYPTCGLFAADVQGLALHGTRWRPRAGRELVLERTSLAG